MFNFRVPAYYVLLSAVLVGSTVFYTSKLMFNRNTDTKKDSNVSTVSANCKTDRKRLEGYNYIKPLIYAEKECESAELTTLKENVINTITLAKNEGLVTSASVYIRVFSKSLWTSVDAEEKYHPASLNKVPVLMTYLHMVESNNKILDEKIAFVKQDTSLPKEFYTSQTIKPGKSYTVKDLLYSMIAYSDNNAALLLLQHMNVDVYNKTFTDLGLEKPSFDYNNFLLTPKEYSLFMRVLYNASYLSIPASEFALEMLANSDFKEGLMKQLPANAKVAHKFGESGYGNIYELHESGIVYIGDNSYIITIMTKGTDLKKQATVISNISMQVYNTIVSAPF